MQTFAELVKAERGSEFEEWEGLETTRTTGKLGWATFEVIYAYLNANLPKGLTLRRDDDGVGWVETADMLAFAFWVCPVPDDIELGGDPKGDCYSTVHLACRLPGVWYYDAGYDPTREGGALDDHPQLYAHMAQLAAIALD